MPRIVGSTGGVGISSLAGVDAGGCRLKGEVGISSLAGVDAGGCRLKGDISKHFDKFARTTDNYKYKPLLQYGLY